MGDKEEPVKAVEDVKAVENVKAVTSNWWNKLPKQVRDVLLVSAGVLGGIALVKTFYGDNSVDDSEGPDEGPVLDEMKQQMKAASNMAKYAKKMANKAIKNADKAIAATKSKN